MLVDLPSNLRDALQQLSRSVPSTQLMRAASDLSVRYREGTATGVPVARGAEDVAAYAAYRFPATYAAIVAALQALKEQRPGWTPTTVLDLGAGLGAGLWAAASLWPDLQQMTGVDVVPEMISAGQRLAESSRHPAVRSANWLQANLQTAPNLQTHDLILIAYVLGEIDPLRVNDLLNRAWIAARSALVIVEPGTPAGYRRVREAREYLAGRGAHSLAPCPHDPPCEVPDEDWMHFAVRLPRSKLQRSTKGADMSYEDEKFSYVALAREAPNHTYSRILRHPQIRKGHVYLQLCTPDGVKTVVVSKRDGQLYNRARKASWGDVFELPES